MVAHYLLRLFNKDLLCGRVALSARPARMALRTTFARSVAHRQVSLISSHHRALHSSAGQSVRYRRFGQTNGHGEQQESLPRRAPIAAPLPFTPSVEGFKRWYMYRGWGPLPGLVGIAAIGIGVYVVLNLERVPQTGRLRFNSVSVSSERRMGEEAFRQMMQIYRGRILPASDARVQLVRRVASRLLQAAEEQKFTGKAIDLQGGQHASRSKSNTDPPVQWDVFVVESKEQNAFVLPNGKIFVFTGILPICHDEDGLATVLGHEISHQLAHHGSEKASQSTLTMALFVLSSFLLGTDTTQFAHLTLQLFKDLPNSRKMETEADRIGLWLMSAACYDPSKAPSVWQRMMRVEGAGSSKDGGGVDWLHTHPSSQKRMQKLQDWKQEAIQIRQASHCADIAEHKTPFYNALRGQVGLQSR